jgi:hypothetical protein
MAADHTQPSDLVRPGEPPLPAFWAGPRRERGLPALLVSVGFSLWVRYFADYGRVYGFLGSIVMVLTWLWLVNLAPPYGLELDECLRRRRASRAAVEGRPAREEVPG